MQPSNTPSSPCYGSDIDTPWCFVYLACIRCAGGSSGRLCSAATELGRPSEEAGKTSHMPLHTVISMGGNRRSHQSTAATSEGGGPGCVEEDNNVEGGKEFECLTASVGLGVWGLLMEPTRRDVMFPVVLPPTAAVGRYSCESLSACHLSGTLAVSWRYPPPSPLQQHGGASSSGPYHSILQRALIRSPPISEEGDFSVAGWYQVGTLSYSCTPDFTSEPSPSPNTPAMTLHYSHHDASLLPLLVSRCI